MPKIVEVNNLVKRYGDVVAVDGVSFSVEEGEILGILGPNGAGKTTTLEIIETLRSPDEGEVWVNGYNVCRQPDAVKRSIGVQLQSSEFFNDLTLTELLNLFAALYGKKINPEEFLSKVLITQKAGAFVNELSGGQKRRFSLATALVHQPKILFLDEPTTGLDPQARRSMWDLVKKIRDEGRTIILTTHYMDEAEFLCDRVAIMDEGKIVALDTPAALIDALLERGFTKEHLEKRANLEDVFLDLTGKHLREE